MRIAFFAFRDLANPLAGGSELLIDRLASGLASRGHEVTLVCAEPVAPRAYRVIPNGSFTGQFVRAPLVYWRNLRDSDLVVDVANGLAFYAPLWRRGPSLCLVNHVHTEQWSQWFPAPVATLGRTIERRAMPVAYRQRLFVAVSDSTADSLVALGVNRDQIRIVPNGVDLPTELPRRSVEPLFLCVGRLVPHKQYEVAIDAWQKVRARVGGRLIIVGEGPELARLKARPTDGVEFRGRVDEAEKVRLYGEAWGLVHPAMLEGWGLVVAEAAASATPALGFFAPGVRDSVVHGETGLLAHDADELTANWLALATDPDLRDRLGANARVRASTFSWDASVERFEAVADEAVLGHRRPTRAPAAGVVAAPSGAPNVKGPSADVLDLRTHSGATHLRGRRLEQFEPALTVIVPSRNDEDRVPEALERVLATVDPDLAEILVVDDASDDGTARRARGVLDAVAHGRVLCLPEARGHGASMRAGVAAARGKVIALVDLDMAPDVDQLPGLLARLDRAHVAVGWRAQAEPAGATLPTTRAVARWGLNRLSHYALELPVRDAQCGLKAFRGPVAKLLFHLARDDGWAIDSEVLAFARRIGYETVEVPLRWTVPTDGRVRLFDAATVASSLLRARASTRPGRVTAAVEAWSRHRGVGSDELVADLRSHLSPVTPVVAVGGSALALLPFAAVGDAAFVASQLASRLPSVITRRSIVAPAHLFEGGDDGLRAALVAG